MHNAIDYFWIGKKWICTIHEHTMYEDITIHRQLIWICVEVYYLSNIYLIQLIRWIHLILKPKKEKHEWEVMC